MLSLIPGPTQIATPLYSILQDYPNPALWQPLIPETYARAEYALQQILKTKNSIAIQTGEGMLALWSALKSTLQPGDRVVSLANGVFGAGIADCARRLGAEVIEVTYPENEGLTDLTPLSAAIEQHHPKMLTAVHTDTPTGLLNPIKLLGQIKHDYQIPLLYVDAVSSIGGTPLLTDSWHIDLCLGGSQKVLGCPADLSFVSISPKAWKIAEERNYAGYDALLPWREVSVTHKFPYTPHFHGLLALQRAAELLIQEGIGQVIERHQTVARSCYQGLLDLGLQPFLPQPEFSAPTVTAAYLPQGLDWRTFDKKMRQQDIALGGSIAQFHNRLFRIGHMGSQAQLSLVQRALSALATIL